MRRFRWATLFLAALGASLWSALAFAGGIALMAGDGRYVHTVLIPALAVVAVVVILSLRIARRLWNCRPFGLESW